VPVGRYWTKCLVVEAGPEENPDEVVVETQRIGGTELPRERLYARGRNAMAVLTAALTLMAMSVPVLVSLNDD
jgi:hypothetical protein